MISPADEILADKVLSEALNRLEEAVIDANLAAHDYVLLHGGVPQQRDYFLLVMDRRQTKLLINFLLA
jgi:hypothetical protein